jgi:hypothetical protein
MGAFVIKKEGKYLMDKDSIEPEAYSEDIHAAEIIKTKEEAEDVLANGITIMGVEGEIIVPVEIKEILDEVQ